MVQLEKLSADPTFWTGVLASLVAAALFGLLAFISKNSFSILIKWQENRNETEKALEEFLEFRSSYAPFSYGIIQARALRHFILAALFTALGDLSDLFYPFGLIFYVISIFFFYLSIRWLYKIEAQGMEMLASVKSSHD